MIYSLLSWVILLFATIVFVKITTLVVFRLKIEWMLIVIFSCLSLVLTKATNLGVAFVFPIASEQFIFALSSSAQVLLAVAFFCRRAKTTEGDAIGIWRSGLIGILVIILPMVSFALFGLLKNLPIFGWQ